MRREDGDRESASQKHIPSEDLPISNLKSVREYVLFLFLVLIIFVAINIYNIGLVTIPTPPAYNLKRRLDISLKLLQVAVLYFAVLVAAFQYLDSSDRINFESNRLLFLIVLLSLVLVSISALSSILVMFKLPGIVLHAALGLMAAAFILFLIAAVAALASDTAKQSSDPNERETGQHRNRVVLPGVSLSAEQDRTDSETQTRN